MICAKCSLCVENCWFCKYLIQKPYIQCNEKKVLEDYKKLLEEKSRI